MICHRGIQNLGGYLFTVTVSNQLNTCVERASSYRASHSVLCMWIINSVRLHGLKSACTCVKKASSCPASHSKSLLSSVRWIPNVRLRLASNQLVPVLRKPSPTQPHVLSRFCLLYVGSKCEAGLKSACTCVTIQSQSNLLFASSDPAIVLGDLHYARMNSDQISDAIIIAKMIAMEWECEAPHTMCG